MTTITKLQAEITKLNATRTGAIATIEEIDAKLPQLQASLDKLTAEAAARAAIESTGLPVGTTVTFEFGRGDTRRTQTGKVVAFRAKTDTIPAAYKVEVGEGFDLDVITVLAANVKAA